MLIEAELKGVEEKFGLDLGLSAKVADEGPVEYYPQFEHSVRAEAAEMAAITNCSTVSKGQFAN